MGRNIIVMSIKKRSRFWLKIAVVLLAVLTVAIVLWKIWPDEEKSQVESSNERAYRHIEVDGKQYDYNTNMLTLLCMGIDTTDDSEGQSDVIDLMVLDRENEKMKKLFVCALAAAMMLAAGCSSGSSSSSAPSAASPAAPAASQAAGSEAAGGDASLTTVTPGKFTIGMECAYAPFNWTQLEKTDTAVDIGSASYADGYDVVMGKYIAEQLGLELVVKPIAWEGLEPAVNNGEIDAIIAGMTATPERRENVDFTDPYYESKMVVIVRKDSDLTNITSIQDLSGRKVQGQLNTLYDTVIDQIEGVDHVTPLATYPLMVVALQSGEVDALTAELPVAAGVVASNPDLTYVEFAEGSGFEADTSVSIAVKKGNTALLDAIQSALASVSEEDRQQWMIDATSRQPAQE